jgi:HlyD family secretion protein
MSTTNARLLRIILPTVIVLLIVSGDCRYWIGTNSDQDELVLYGNVDLREVELAFILQERIAGLFVEEGDHVNKGDLLTELESILFRQAVMQREAELEHGSRPEEILRAKAELAIERATERDAR